MQASLSKLVVNYRPMLVAYARALMQGDEHQAEDVVQECLLTVHENFEQFREDGDFGSWLRGIARNKVLEKHRRDSRLKFVSDLDIVAGIDETFAGFDALSPLDESWRDRALRLLDRCLKKLTPGLRSMIEHVYQSGRSLRDSAELLSITESAAAQRLSRARDQVRECVQYHREQES